MSLQSVQNRLRSGPPTRRPMGPPLSHPKPSSATVGGPSAADISANSDCAEYSSSGKKSGVTDFSENSGSKTATVATVLRQSEGHCRTSKPCDSNGLISNCDSCDSVSDSYACAHARTRTRAHGPAENTVATVATVADPPLWLCRCRSCFQWQGDPYNQCTQGFVRFGVLEGVEAEMALALERWHFCAYYRGPAEGHLAPAELQAMCEREVRA